MEENKKNTDVETSKDVLKEYESQSESDDIHFEHVDWTYNDSSCCC